MDLRTLRTMSVPELVDAAMRQKEDHWFWFVCGVLTAALWEDKNTRPEAEAIWELGHLWDRPGATTILRAVRAATIEPKYHLLYDEEGKVYAITCLTCNLSSHNVNDVAQRYCGHCHVFHNEVLPS